MSGNLEVAQDLGANWLYPDNEHIELSLTGDLRSALDVPAKTR